MTKLDKLRQDISNYTKQDIAVAFSGGVDSSLVLKLVCEAAKENRTKVYAVTAHTTLHPAADLDIAKEVSKELGAIHEIITIDELNETDILFNPVNRCYLCKKGIFQKLKYLAAQYGISTVLEGTNEDDLHEYRPGIAALKELGIISPLADCGITKKEVREYAKEYGISVAERPSSPCLATRIPYGEKLDYGLLKRIEAGENYLKSMGFYNVRLRIHGNIARIEVDEDSIPKLISEKKRTIEYLKELGFLYVTVDLEGFRSGSMDIINQD